MPGPQGDLRAYIAASWGLLRHQPWSYLGLGFCVHVAFAATCCGLGLLITPWFACELVAQQVASLKGVGRVRHRGWVWAMVAMLVAQLFVASALVFAWVGFSTSAPLLGADIAPTQVAYRPIMLFAATTFFALLLLTPVVFVPHRFLEKTRGFKEALALGLSDVRRRGYRSTFALVCSTQAVQVLVLVCGGALTTLIWGRHRVPYFVCALFPLQVLLFVLTHGIISAAFVDNLERENAFNESGLGRREGHLEVAVILFPVLMCVMSVFALTQPAPLPLEALFEGVEVFRSTEDKRTFRTIDADVSLSLDGDGQLELSVSDGGGAGIVADNVRSFVVQEREQSYVALLSGGEKSRALHFDRAAVRIDDGLSDRIEGHIPQWYFLMLVFAMGAGAWTVYRRSSRASKCLVLAYNVGLAGLAIWVNL